MKFQETEEEVLLNKVLSKQEDLMELLDNYLEGLETFDLKTVKKFKNLDDLKNDEVKLEIEKMKLKDELRYKVKINQDILDERERIVKEVEREGEKLEMVLRCLKEEIDEKDEEKKMDKEMIENIVDLMEQLFNVRCSLQGFDDEGKKANFVVEFVDVNVRMSFAFKDRILHVDELNLQDDGVSALLGCATEEFNAEKDFAKFMASCYKAVH